MTKKQIIESGFIKAFIAEYFEDKLHSFYPDKDRLLYILCNSEQEKKEVTKKQIEITKAKVTELGFDELSFAYLLSCKPESLHNYIEPDKRYSYWLRSFTEEAELYLSEIENPEFLELARNDIVNYKKDEYWELDFEEYKQLCKDSEPIQSLFALSELFVQLSRLEMFNEFLEIENEALPPQQTEKPKPELNEALISFSSTEIIESLHNELKGYFQGKEAELKKALQGENLKEFLLFPHNQNKFVEVFKRLRYNRFLLSTPKETKDWICSTFTYQYQKGNKKEVREFNTSTVHDILTKNKGEPTKKERICIVDWLPYKSYLKRQSEAEKESI